MSKEQETWERLGFEKVNIQSEKTMGDRLDDLPNELNPIKQLKELKTILLGQHHIADCEALDMAIKALELQERFERYTMQDDMHLVTIKQIKEVMKGEWL